MRSVRLVTRLPTTTLVNWRLCSALITKPIAPFGSVVPTLPTDASLPSHSTNEKESISTTKTNKGDLQRDICVIDLAIHDIGESKDQWARNVGIVGLVLTLAQWGWREWQKKKELNVDKARFDAAKADAIAMHEAALKGSDYLQFAHRYDDYHILFEYLKSGKVAFTSDKNLMYLLAHLAYHIGSYVLDNPQEVGPDEKTPIEWFRIANRHLAIAEEKWNADAKSTPCSLTWFKSAILARRAEAYHTVDPLKAHRFYDMAENLAKGHHGMQLRILLHRARFASQEGQMSQANTYLTAAAKLIESHKKSPQCIDNLHLNDDRKKEFEALELAWWEARMEGWKCLLHADASRLAGCQADPQGMYKELVQVKSDRKKLGNKAIEDKLDSWLAGSFINFLVTSARVGVKLEGGLTHQQLRDKSLDLLNSITEPDVKLDAELDDIEIRLIGDPINVQDVKEQVGRLHQLMSRPMEGSYLPSVDPSSNDEAEAAFDQLSFADQMRNHRCSVLLGLCEWHLGKKEAARVAWKRAGNQLPKQGVPLKHVEYFRQLQDIKFEPLTFSIPSIAPGQWIMTTEMLTTMNNAMSSPPSNGSPSKEAGPQSLILQSN